MDIVFEDRRLRFLLLKFEILVFLNVIIDFFCVLKLFVVLF